MAQLPDPHQLRLQNLEQQRRERTMCRLRDAVLSRAAAAGRSGNINVAAVERRIQELIPSFHTPTHPPYASMIQRAIEELNEEGGGVSEVAISEFIKREYEGLAWAHETMLRVHLKKQCEMGVLVLEGGRYSFNLVKDGDDGGYVDVETESRRKRRPGQGRRGRGRWRSKEEGKVNDEAFEGEGIGRGDGQNGVMGQSERANMDTVENASPAYIKLRNQGEVNKDEMTEEQVQAEVGEDEVVIDNNQREKQQSREEPQPQHDQQQQNLQQEGQEKRRPGRPKANKVMELAPYVPEEQPLALRRRGRSKATGDMDLGTYAEVPCDIEPLNEEQPPRSRGRSKAKSGMDLGTIAEVPCDIEPLNVEQPPRRQGRSKDQDDMEANATSEVPCALEHPQSEQPLKRRGPGRPPKTKPDLEASLTVLSSSDIQHHS